MTGAVLDDPLTETRARAHALRQDVKLLEEALQGFQERRRADARMGLDCRPHALKERQLESDLRGLREELGVLDVRIYQYDIGAAERKLSERNAILRAELLRVVQGLQTLTLQGARTARWECEQVDVQLTGLREGLRLQMAALSNPLEGIQNRLGPVVLDETAMGLLHQLERAFSALTDAKQYAATMGIR